MKALIAASIVVLLSACGGGDDFGQPVHEPNATHGGQVVQLRACETTGPTAPACPEKS